MKGTNREMHLIDIDMDKCIKDGLCAEVCPSGIIAFDEEKGPKVRSRLASYCIGCGHCVSVCPTGALDNERNPLAEQPPSPLVSPFDPDAALVFLRMRRSIRRYKDEPLSEELLLRLLEASRFSPSGHNTQGISFIVARGKEPVRRMAELVVEWMRTLVEAKDELAAKFHMAGLIKAWDRGEDQILRNAPAVIVAHAPSDLSPAQPTTYLKLEYVELYAPVLGLGTCWAGFAQACARQYTPLSDYLGIPEGHSVTGMMMVGRPRFPFRRLPARNSLEVAWLGE